jgi:hypothetical protein
VATTVTAKPNGPTQVTSSANHREPTAPGTTQILSPPRTFNPLLRLLGILSLWLVGGIAAYLLSPDVRSWVDSIVSIRPMPEPTLPEPTATPPSSPAPIALSVGSLVQIRPLPGSGLSLAPVVLQSQPGLSVLPTDQPGEHPLPAGTVLQILNRQTSIQRDIWLQLKVCSLPTSTELPLSSVQPGETGWVLEPTIAPLLVSEFTLTATELGKCAPVTASPTPRRSP